MKLLSFLSEFMIPLIVFYIVGYGILQKQNVYEQFIRGAEDGFKTVVKILPTLLGLMVGVGVLRSSGFLDFRGDIVPLVIVRMFSSSAATGLCLDIFKKFGPDSFEGILASIIMSCTETIFYTMSIYFMAAKVKKTRYTLPGAIVATMAGVLASVLLANRLV